MREIFEEDLQTTQGPKDTEFTVGPLLMAGLVLGLLALCGGFYTFGYQMGLRAKNSHELTPASGATAQQNAAPAASGKAKPSATNSSAPQSASSRVAAQADSQVAPKSAPAADASLGWMAVGESSRKSANQNNAKGYADSTPTPQQTAVRSVEPALHQSAQPATPSAQTVKPALKASAGSYSGESWVQVSMTRESGDAQLLASALRRRVPFNAQQMTSIACEWVHSLHGTMRCVGTKSCSMTAIRRRCSRKLAAHPLRQAAGDSFAHRCL